MREIGDWFGLPSVDQAEADVLVVGCPFEDSVSGRPGAAGGPAELRRWSRSCEAIDERGRRIEALTVHDLGDAPAEGDRTAAIRATVGVPEPGQFLLGLGGDHAVTPHLLSIARMRHPDLALLLLDAHADLFDAYEGRRDSHACAMARAWDEVGIDPAHTAMLGLRSFAGTELAPLARAGVVLPAAEWLELGAERAAERVITALAGRPVYLSLDIDVLDPACAPGTGYPVAGGPNSRQLLQLLERLWPRLDFVGMDMVEIAPSLDPAAITAPTGAQILLQVLGMVAADRIRQ